MARDVVGFIGLGRMGRPMAENLLRAGYRLVVHNRSRAPVELLVAEGAEAANDPAAVAQAADVICTCLPDPPAVEAVLAGPGGALGVARQGQVFVDFSTVGPATSRAMAAAAEARGAAFLDAPVSGGVTGARQATLAVMVGGPAEAFARVRPLLEVLGRHVVHVGPSGAGAVTKLANQMIVGITTLAIAEALVLATKAGADPAVVAGVLGAGFANSTVFQRHVPGFILPGTFEAAFKLELLEKDVRLACDLGREAGVRLLHTSLAQQLLTEARALGFGELDMAAAIRPLEMLAGVEVRAADGRRGGFPARGGGDRGAAG